MTPTGQGLPSYEHLRKSSAKAWNEVNKRDARVEQLEAEAAELRERVGELEGALQKAEEYISANIAFMYQRYDYLIPSDGLSEEKLRDELRAALSQAKPENQEESVEKPEVES